MRRYRGLLSALSALACASCGQSDPAPADTPTGRVQQHVWNGLGTGGPADATGIVHMVTGMGISSPKPTTQSVVRASGPNASSVEPASMVTAQRART